MTLLRLIPSRLKTTAMVAALVLLIGAGIFLYNTFDISSQAITYRLGALGAGIYEYHDQTGQWPGRAADLSRTSMALRLKYWQDDLETGRVVVVWPHDWKPDPRDNADRILAYYNAGLISRFGRNWVCWGDLRTEYLPTERLRAILATNH